MPFLLLLFFAAVFLASPGKVAGEERSFRAEVLPTCDKILYGSEYLVKNRENIIKRKSGIAMIFNNDSDKPVKFEYGTYDEIKDRLEAYYKMKQEKAILNRNEFTGQVANAGRAIGIVKIIHNVKNIKKFTNKNILVSSMTRP